jgi:lipid A 3-O-deacylase
MWCRWALAALVMTLSINAQTTFTLQEEDDSLVRPALRSDEGYTNGTRMLWSWTPTDLSPLETFAAILCLHQPTTECTRTVTAGIGQNMYTPENLRSPTPIRGDRPYGGWLYGTLMFDATRAYTNDHVELYAGVIGRDSHAADAQIFVHKHVTPGAPDPLGWDTQIGEWAAVLATYERRVKLLSLRAGSDGPEWFDVAPAVGGSAGNVFVNASAGATVRLGYNLPTHFIQPIRAVSSSLRTQAREAPPAPPEERNWDAFVYLIANASYVARNVFIDAEDDRYFIERIPREREHRAGASFRVRQFRFAYQYTWHSAEFRALIPRIVHPDRPHSYGMVMISIGPNP